MRLVVSFLLCGVLFLDALVCSRAQQATGARQISPQHDHPVRKAASCPSTTTGQSRDEGRGTTGDGVRAQAASQPGGEYCLEVKGDPAALKKCVTSSLQEKGWSPSPAKLSEHLSFWKRVEPKELRRVAVTEIASGNIHWAEARVDATLGFQSRGKGQTEIHLFVNILGRGNTSLPTMRPSDWWPLMSTGRVEADLLAGLQASCEGKERTPAAAASGSPRSAC
jgi:hypothetical protein